MVLFTANFVAGFINDRKALLNVVFVVKDGFLHIKGWWWSVEMFFPGGQVDDW